MNMLRASKVENISCEEQAKFIQERLLETEDWLSKMCSSFSLYTKKVSGLRDATDSLAILLNNFATNERINKSTKSQIHIFSDLLASLGDVRDNKVQQLQANVLNNLAQYNVLCRNAKSEVKSSFSIKEKEAIKRKQLGKVRTLGPYNARKVAKAEGALSTAVSDVSQAQRELENHIFLFEKKKLEDIKTIILQYISLELNECSKSIQIFTQAFSEIKNINVKNDLKNFNEVLKMNPISQRVLQIQNNSTIQSTLPDSDRLKTSCIMDVDEESGDESSETFEKLTENSDKETQ